MKNTAQNEKSVFGESPSGWSVDRIRDRLKDVIGGEWGDDPNAHDDGTLIPVIRVADIQGLDVSTANLTIRRVKNSKLHERLINKKTILIEKSGGGELKPVGRAVLGRNISEDAICSNFMAKVDCADKIYPLFIAYLLETTYSSGINTAHIQQTTGIQNLRVADYLNTKVAFPDLKEQQLIADYLDASCAAIDSAIGCKSKQIESLKELRAAWFHQIFSNKSWPQERIKDIVLKIGSGVTPDGGAANYLDHGIPLIRSQNVTFEGLKLDDVAYISEDTHKLMSNSQLKPCDVLLNITGASIGRCTYVPEEFGEANVNQHVCIIRCNHKIDYRFLAAFLQSPVGQNQVFSSFTGASRQGLSHKELGLMTIPLPEIEIQVKVVEEFDKKLLSHKQIQSCIEKQIAALLAYRRSLIHECVTGRRRVTEADVKKVREHGW